MSTTQIKYKRGDAVLVKYGNGTQVAIYLGKGTRGHYIRRWHSQGWFYPGESGLKDAKLLGLAHGDPRRAPMVDAWLKELAKAGGA